MSTADYAGRQAQLPKQFVKSLKVLFDILDEHNTGYVHLSDIESRWKGFDIKGLPKGIIEAWRSVALPDRRLNFDRFISGIQLSLSQQQQQQTRRALSPVPLSGSGNSNNASKYAAASRNPCYAGGPHRSGPHPDVIPDTRPANAAPHAVPAPVPHPAQLSPNSKWTSSRSTAVATHRTFSMPQLPNASKPAAPDARTGDGQAVNTKENIVDALKKWQIERMNNPSQVPNHQLRNEPRSSVSSMSALDYFSDTEAKKTHEKHGFNDDTAVIGTRRRVIRRHEGRRHTVTNGVDFQMIKNMRKLKQQEGMLLHGLEMLDTARHWYQTQIRMVQDKQKYLDMAQPQGSSADNDQDLSIQAARISEVNHQLNLLMHSTNKSFPHHMNLAIHVTTDQLQRQLQEKDELIQQLRQQNKQLTREVSQMAETIKKLEQEKTQVIREMFNATSKHRYVNHEESSYI